MKIATLESSREKQLLCIRLTGVKLRKLRGGSSLASSVNLRISIWSTRFNCIIICRLGRCHLWFTRVFVTPTCCLFLLKAVRVNLCPQGVEYRWNYNSNHATWLAHLLLQVCCLICLSEGVSSLFVLFPHYFVTLPGKVRLALPVKHHVQMSHPHPSTKLMSLTKLRLWVHWATTKTSSTYMNPANTI